MIETRLLIIICPIFLLGCGEALEPEVQRFIDDPTEPFPERISELGLYTSLPDRDVVTERAFSYEPLYPLWSNGSEKARYLVLPAGSRIDNSDRDSWRFPIGTLFFKTFDPFTIAALPLLEA